jgi:DNA polymerase-3 subunit epsilon
MPGEQLGEMFARVRAGLRRTLAKGALLDQPEMRVLHERLRALDPRPLVETPLQEARFVVIDTETTGFHAYAGDEICSISLIELRGLEPTGRELDTLVNPGRPIPGESTDIHHITDRDVQDAPVIEEVLPEVVDFMDGGILVGHHIGFDMRFLNKTLQRQLLCRLKHPWLDTMMLYLAASGRVGHYTLEDVAAFSGVRIEQRHTAHGDAVATSEVFRQLARRLSEPAHPVSVLIERQYELGQF